MFGGNGLANKLRNNPEFAYRETERTVIDVLAESMLKYLWSFTTVHQSWNFMHEMICETSLMQQWWFINKPLTQHVSGTIEPIYRSTRPYITAYGFQPLTLWRRNYFFFLISAHSVYKIWIIQEPNKLALWNKLHFEGEKRRV